MIWLRSLSIKQKKYTRQSINHNFNTKKNFTLVLFLISYSTTMSDTYDLFGERIRVDRQEIEKMSVFVK